MDPGTDHSTDRQGKIIHSAHHKTLDQITEAATTQTTMMATTDRLTAETMAETGVTNNNQDTKREIRTTQTGMTTTKIEIGMTTIKIETGSTTEGDQTNINTTETNTKLKSSSNSRTKMGWK